MHQLHEDLTAIRTHLQLSMQDVHDRTKISLDNIEQLENGMMFESDRNTTYIRNFARTYGKCLGIPMEEMSNALDLEELGQYDGFLAKKYLPKSSSEKSDKKGGPGSAEESPAGLADTETEAGKSVSAPEPETGTRNTGQKSSKATGAKPAEAGKNTASSRTEKSKQTGRIKQTSSGTAGMKTGQGSRPADKEPAKAPPAKKVLDGSSIQPGYGTVGSKKPGMRDVNWSQLRQNAEKPGSGLSIQLIGGIVVIVLLLAALGYWLTMPESPEEMNNGTTQSEINPESRPEGFQPEDSDLPESESDPLATDSLDAPVAPDPSMTEIVLADTLEVVIYAATGNLEPFRVESDTFEQRRPYWVEQGQGMRIKFVDEMRLRSSLSNMLILYEDRVLDTFDEASTDEELVITRDLFESADSLDAITSEEYPEGIEPPGAVYDRPILQQ